MRGKDSCINRLKFLCRACQPHAPQAPSGLDLGCHLSPPTAPQPCQSWTFHRHLLPSLLPQEAEAPLPTPSTLLHCCGSPHPEHPLQDTPLSSALLSPPLWGDQAPTRHSGCSVDLFLPQPLELRDATPDTQAQLAPPPIASALPPFSLQNLPSGPDPCLTLMSSLHPTSGMDSPPTRHMASYSSRLSARYPLRCLSPLHLIPACPARTRATVWHSRPFPAGTCCCTSSTPGI